MASKRKLKCSPPAHAGSEAAVSGVMAVKAHVGADGRAAQLKSEEQHLSTASLGGETAVMCTSRGTKALLGIT